MVSINKLKLTVVLSFLFFLFSFFLPGNLAIKTHKIFLIREISTGCYYKSRPQYLTSEQCFYGKATRWKNKVPGYFWTLIKYRGFVIFGYILMYLLFSLLLSALIAYIFPKIIYGIKKIAVQFYIWIKT